MPVSLSLLLQHPNWSWFRICPMGVREPLSAYRHNPGTACRFACGAPRGRLAVASKPAVAAAEFRASAGPTRVRCSHDPTLYLLASTNVCDAVHLLCTLSSRQAGCPQLLDWGRAESAHLRKQAPVGSSNALCVQRHMHSAPVREPDAVQWTSWRTLRPLPWGKLQEESC